MNIVSVKEQFYIIFQVSIQLFVQENEQNVSKISIILKKIHFTHISAQRTHLLAEQYISFVLESIFLTENV